MGSHRSLRRWRLVLAAATIFGILALAVPLSVRPGVARVAELPGWAPPTETTVVDERFAFADRAAPPESPAPAPAPAPAPDIPDEPAPIPPPAPDACADALTWVEGTGLDLPDGVGYHCPSTQFPHHGAACWDAWPCRGTGFIAINMDLMRGTGTDYLRHVVAHEVCHIIDFQTTGRSTEPGADACAAAHGAPA